MNYEDLLIQADSVGVTVKEKPLLYNDGRQKGKRIAIRKNIQTSVGKACVLAEELGHYYTTVGNILDRQDPNNIKQEYQARMWSYNYLIGLHGIVDCYRAGCMDLYEMADHLGVTEAFLKDAIDCYHEKYGLYARLDNYIIYFEPCLLVYETLTDCCDVATRFLSEPK